jgi:demethoxyubiquinone hydroxylase (CLK1/Coq7/Cat5 family)
MTVKEACAEIRAISNNMSLDYSEHYDDAVSAEQIIEDLEETIRQFHEIISKMKVLIAENFADKIFSDPEELEILKSLAER